MVEVTLNAAELHMAAHVGVQRQIEAVQKGLPDRHGFEGLGWDVHVEGACGELAVAAALNRYWNGSVNTFKSGGDVGAVQVRTRSRHSYELLVRPDDADDAYYIHVTGRAPTYRVWGYIQGVDAKQPQYLQTYAGRPAAYFVPVNALLPLGPVRATPRVQAAESRAL